ncbi:hypothetical protein [Winslowiella toletana]|uniref:hypothetical protein n=1 Tax=Winslowiella toletana TaxID=92490 RepID=UPI0028BE681A|nr:hypothetical protein [Winslowiella toletana]WNN46685.1 hypothetical protein RIN69_22405 [Winslowiella toletana]
MNNRALKTYSLWVPLTFSIAFLCGCEGSKFSVPAAEQEAVATAQQKTVAQTASSGEKEELTRLAQCQKELDALKDINPGQHKLLQQSFEQLMKGAAQYASLRSQVNTETQETMDALYHYKAKRLCANIAQTTLNGLAERGERQK